jgi:hypothetical protein
LKQIQTFKTDRVSTEDFFVLAFLLFEALVRHFCLAKFKIVSFIDGVQDASDGKIASVDDDGGEVQALSSILLLQTPALKYQKFCFVAPFIGLF